MVLRLSGNGSPSSKSKQLEPRATLGFAPSVAWFTHLHARALMVRSEPRGERPAPRLYIVTPPLGDARRFAADLEDVLRAGDVAALLLRSAATDFDAVRRQLETLAPLTQRSGTALLIEAMPELAAHSAADGAHICDPSALADALKILKPDRIVGAGGLKTRHDAMVAGEAGADYVMFGEPDAAGDRPSLETLLERVAWWAELFELPCVAFAGHLGEVPRLVAAGADFIAAGDLVWNDMQGPAAGVRALAAGLGTRETV